MDDCCDYCNKPNLERYVEIAGRRWIGNEYMMDGYHRLCFMCFTNEHILLKAIDWVV